MKKAITTLLLLLLSFRMMGQIDYLEPVKDYTKHTNEINGYYNNVFSLLNFGISHKPYAYYAALPSFSPEYALSVESREGKYFLLSNTLSQNSWQVERNSIKVKTSSTEIGKTLYTLLGELLSLTTGQIQDMDGSTSGLDGITYYFTTTNNKGEIMTGKKWSPDRNTLMGRLVAIFESAYSLSLKKGLSEEDIINNARRLIKSLEDRSKAHPDQYKKPRYAGNFQTGVWKSCEPGKELEIQPELPDSTLEDYAMSNLIYPPKLLAKAAKGYALCEFTVNREGKVVNPHILKCSYREFGEEALRIVNSLPQFVPGMSGGVPVDCNYVLYIPCRPKPNLR